MARMSRLSRSLAGAALVLVALLTTSVATQPANKKILFLTHAGLYKHTSLAVSEDVMKDIGPKHGFDVTTLEGYKQPSDAIDLSIITPEYLNQFDGLMLFTNGNLPMTDAQKKAIVDYVKAGHALIGVHSATLTFYDYPEFGEMLGGYYLRSIIPTNQIAQGRIGVLKVEDPNNPATKMLGPSWPINEEFYLLGTKVWDPSTPNENVSQVGRLHIPLAFTRDRVHVLLSLDTEHMDITGLPVEKGGDYPQAWTHEVGRGRVFYTSLGHRDETWHDTVFEAFLTGGIRWALGLE
jgi:type 1 glutamine amidotransferase